MRELVVATCAALLASAACRTPGPTSRPASSLPPPLSAPGPVEPRVRGATLLTQLAAQVQPAWGQFLEDCRTRLPAEHALNVATLSATAELAVDRKGGIALVALATSGNADFDRAVKGVVGDASAIDAPALELLSDDDVVHVRWLFARDRRQAGPATAEVFSVELPLVQIAEAWLARGELARMAARIARAPATAPTRAQATELLMLAALREVVTKGSGADARRVAVEAIGRAKVAALAPEVRRLLAPSTSTELRLAAIATSAALGDRAVVDDLARALPGDLASDPQLAVAEAKALVALGEPALAEDAVRRALDNPAPPPAALATLAVVSIPALDGKLGTWFGHRDPRVREAVCMGITRPAGRAIALRGLRDADATVRTACLDAIARLGSTARGADVLARLRTLARDRDQTVRARAVTALALVKGGSVAGAADDPSAAVRVAAVLDAGEARLATLANDPDPDVRAAAISELGTRAPAATARAAADKASQRERWPPGRACPARAAADKASQVRRAAIPHLTDEAVLERLAVDDAPEVASEALVALVQRRGRAAMTPSLLGRLAALTSERARVRIALAWLLAIRP